MMLLKSRTFLAEVVMLVVGVIVAGLLEVVPELAAYQEALFDILQIAAIAVAARFGLEDLVVAFKTGERDKKYMQ